MMKCSSEIHVAGSGLRGSGYPNATGTLSLLRGLPGVVVRDRSRWLAEGTVLWQKASLTGSGLAFLAKLAFLNALEAIRILPLARKEGVLVYAPYPAVFLLWWLSWLPRSIRPRVVADAYVSLWDSAFRDRRKAGGSGFLGRAAKRFESRALRAAWHVLVDTAANRDWYVSELGILPGRIGAIPLALALPEGANAGSETPSARPLRVLYVGTLVPLHGVQVIVDAVRRLAKAGAQVEFTFVGDGQEGAALEALLASPEGRQVSWHRNWHSLDEIVKKMRQAHVCLGVFGGEGKASRVLPLKVYLALALGKAVVTQEAYSLPEGAPPLPVCVVKPDGESLASALSALSEDESRQLSLAQAASDYFEAHLSRRAIERAWRALLGLQACA